MRAKIDKNVASTYFFNNAEIAMKQRNNKYNAKRRLLPWDEFLESRTELDQLARRVQYGGNPEHKRAPGDFGLTPSASPRPGKTLCDGVGIFRRAIALDLLKQGLAKGLVSAHKASTGWPRTYGL